MNSFYAEPSTGNVPVNAARTQQNRESEFVTPPEESFNTEAMRGSMQQILADNLGNYVVCEFLIGTQNMTKKEGILYAVGRSYVTLFEEISREYIVCDIFSIKFITFYLPGQRPQRGTRGMTTTTSSTYR